jgi:Transposase DDE domain
VWLQLTPGNVDDRKGLLSMVENPFSSLFGKLFGDLGCLSQALFEQLVRDHGLTLFTRLKRNMRTRFALLEEDAWLLRKRCIAESIIDQLKNISQIERSRHRSPVNFVVNLICGLIAYCHQPKKPGVRLVANELVTAYPELTLHQLYSSIHSTSPRSVSPRRHHSVDCGILASKTQTTRQGKPRSRVQP